MKFLEEVANENQGRLIRRFTVLTRRVFNPDNKRRLMDSYLDDCISLLAKYEQGGEPEARRRISDDLIREAAEKMIKEKGEVSTYHLFEAGYIKEDEMNEFITFFNILKSMKERN